MSTPTQRIPLLVKLLAVLMTLVVSGVGILALVSHYAPERSTRHGVMSALEGAPADTFGIIVFLVGLLPLALLLGSARRAAWFGCIVALLIAASLLLNAR